MPTTNGTNLKYANMLADVQKNELLLNEFWSKTLLEMIKMERDNFVFTTLAKKISIPKKAGTKTWTVRRYLHLPVDLERGRLSEGMAPVPMKVEGQKVSATIDQFGAYVEETDVEADIHFDNIMQIYQPELARHAAETIERNVLEKLSAEASVRYQGDATSDDTIEIADVLDFAAVRRAWLRMRNYHREGHPSFGGAPVLVAHINVIQDLIDDEDLKDYIIVPGYDETPIKNGSLTQFKLYGIYFVETKILEPVENASGVNVYTSYLLGRDGYVLADLGGGGVSWHQKGFKAEYGDPLAQRATLGYKLWTGAKVTDPMAIMAIKSSSAYDVGIVADLATDIHARAASQYDYDSDGDEFVSIDTLSFVSSTGVLTHVATYADDMSDYEGYESDALVEFSDPLPAGTYISAITYEGNSLVVSELPLGGKRAVYMSELVTSDNPLRNADLTGYAGRTLTMTFTFAGNSEALDLSMRVQQVVSNTGFRTYRVVVEKTIDIVKDAV
ncbi:MAG: N4-gp56 family major capsid protein [Bacteroidales bacterium]|nr:N4-gp56 family major capsid protein [Bacteroidales bacterium]